MYQFPFLPGLKDLNGKKILQERGAPHKIHIEDHPVIMVLPRSDLAYFESLLVFRKRCLKILFRFFNQIPGARE